MADFDSSLPVRTENNGDVVSRISDGTVTSQLLAVNADGSLNITDNAGSLTVDATDFDIRDLAFATDSVDVSGSTVALDAPTLAALESITVQNGSGGAAVNIQDGGNSITVDGSVTVSATDLDIRDLVFATDKVDVSNSTVNLSAGSLAALESITVQNGAGAAAVNIQDGGNSITVDGSVTVSATDLDIRDLSHTQDSVKIGDGTDFLAVNTDGSINVVVSDSTPGVAANDYNTAASLAAAASSTHTYTSTGNFYLSQIEASASGKMKIVVAVNGAIKFVKFNSTAETNFSITLSEPIIATTGQTVTIVRTNRELLPQDVYSTISGYTL